MRNITVGMLATAFFVILAAPPVMAQGEGPREDLRARLAALIRYVGVEKSAAPADLDRLTDLWSTAAGPDTPPGEREAAFRELNVLYAKLHGVDLSARPQAVAGLARRATAAVEAGARLDLRLPEPRGTVSGDYLNVETHGHGSVRMLLIPAFGVDGREAYRSLIERHKHQYTMHVLTLPGARPARQQPWPETFDLTRRPWLANIERSLLRLLDRQKGRLVVVGTTGGGYFAARLALLRPEKVSAAVLIDARVHIPMPSPSAPERPASPQERLAIMKRFTPMPQLYPAGEVPASREEIRRLLYDPNNKHPAVRDWMAGAVKDEPLSKRWSLEALASGFFLRGLRYTFELQTTDLTEDLKSLTVPTLVMVAVPDEKSPLAGASGAAQWEEVKKLYPSLPLKVVSFANTRSFISEDNPAEFDRALSAFLAGLD